MSDKNGSSGQRVSMKGNKRDFNGVILRVNSAITGNECVPHDVWMLNEACDHQNKEGKEKNHEIKPKAHINDFFQVRSIMDKLLCFSHPSNKFLTHAWW